MLTKKGGGKIANDLPAPKWLPLVTFAFPIMHEEFFAMRFYYFFYTFVGIPFAYAKKSNRHHCYLGNLVLFLCEAPILH